MAGYSQVLQIMAALIIFGMILLNANRLIQRNAVMQVEGELEQEVVAVAQDIIEEGRTKEFDEVSVDAAAPPADIPGHFATQSDLGPDSGESGRNSFDDFDDYNGWTETIETEHGEFNVEAQVFYLDPATYDSTGNQSTFKKMRVYITSPYLRNINSDQMALYRLEFIRNYYAD